jgi:hypothetical protein
MKTLLILAFCTLFAACAGTQPATNSLSNAGNATGASNTAPANSSASREYPRETADAFLESCEEAGSTGSFCTCVFEKVQAKYTFEEFSVIESKLIAGTPPEEFVEFTGKARAECTK